VTSINRMLAQTQNPRLSVRYGATPSQLNNHHDDPQTWRSHIEGLFRQNNSGKASVGELGTHIAEAKGYTNAIIMPDDYLSSSDLADYVARLPTNNTSGVAGVIRGHGGGYLGGVNPLGKPAEPWQTIATRQPVFDLLERHFKLGDPVLVSICDKVVPTYSSLIHTHKPIITGEDRDRYRVPDEISVLSGCSGGEPTYDIFRREDPGLQPALERHGLTTQLFNGFRYILPR
jgi:hypothetical protein